MIGQTADICPADKKLYALRDVTGTVPSHALIVASIMSKKLAENLDRLVLDVKFGSGAFMKTREEAVQLAAAMSAVGRQVGVSLAHRLSAMHEPLGHSVGNALEVAEAVETLQGGGPEDLVELTLDLAAEVAIAPRAQLANWLRDGSAWEKFVMLVEAQGGDATALCKIVAFHAAPLIHPFPAPRAGVIERMDAGILGRGRPFFSERVEPGPTRRSISRLGFQESGKWASRSPPGRRCSGFMPVAIMILRRFYASWKKRSRSRRTVEPPGCRERSCSNRQNAETSTRRLRAS